MKYTDNIDKDKFTVLIIGSDMNAYYMARCYHEIYNEKVDMMNKVAIGITRLSKIINFIKVDSISEKESFLRNLNNYAIESKFQKILLIATNDKYVRLISENTDLLNKKFVYNYPDKSIVDTFLIKDKFYNKFKDRLLIPKTIIYSCKEDNIGEINDFTYPIILKPGNGVEYNKHSFEGMSKVYKIQSHSELLCVIDKIKNSGYTDNLIIQEYIPGDDSALFDAVFYCGKDKKAKLMTFAQIGLQERTHTGVGNCTVLVNGYDEHGYNEELIESMKNFLEEIEYQGFAEFDLKYDIRDGKYKVFEINPRQARSSYYLTACGYNLVQYLIDDIIYNKSIDTKLIKEEIVLSFVPKYVINNYIDNVKLKNKINELIKLNKFTRPLHYKKDSSLIVRIYLFLRDINYIIKYRKLNW